MSFSENVADLIERSESDLVSKAEKWPRVPMGSFVEVLNGFPFKSEQFSDAEGAPIIRIRDVTAGHTKTYYRGKIPEGYWVRKGDLVVGMDGDFNSRIWQSSAGLLNQRVCKLSPDPEVMEVAFLARILPGYLSLINEATPSVTVKHLSSKTLKETQIPIPPLPEQRRIVAKLDRFSARSAAVRDHLARTTKLATRAKQAILAHAFQGGLVDSSSVKGTSVPFRDELIRLRDERRLVEGLRKKGKNKSVPISSAVLPDIPDTWRWLTFDDCSWDMTVGHVGPMKDRYVESGIPFLRSLNIKPNAISTRNMRYIDADFDEELCKSRLLPGDLVVVRTGEPGVAAVIDDKLGPCNCSDLVISRLCEFINPHFAAFYMNSSFARNTSSAMQVGVAQRHFNVGAMSVMPVPVPPMTEQREIVRRIESAFVRIERMTEEASRAAHLLDRLDERLLAKAFRGELVPQDTDDEPAEALLARIRDARAAAPKPKRGRRKKIDAE